MFYPSLKMWFDRFFTELNDSINVQIQVTIIGLWRRKPTSTKSLSYIMNDKTTTFFYKLPEMLENIFTV